MVKLLSSEKKKKKMNPTFYDNAFVQKYRNVYNVF